MSGSPSNMSAQSPPYPLRNQGLGGQPAIIPDAPITAVFLVLYLIFGVIHIKIFKANKGRGHKFIFNGAILGLCKIRIITMSLRIAWSCHPTNVGLGIAANVFVYVGTIILFMINWFFVQRIVRAQHQRLGWSMPYRIFHRGALLVLILCLILVVMVSIWQFFTINETKLTAFRAMQLTGQTYFTLFCLAPAVIMLVSALIPRTEIEKFGAGRLRVNITILLIAVAVLTTGQLFRCVIAWIPQTRALDDAGVPIAQPWYLHRACFYCFNFVTEIVVVIMFALVRVDLRFHVPNGSRTSGDYSGRNSRRNSVANPNSESNMALTAASSEKDLVCAAPIVPLGPNDNGSSETIHEYETSVFDDSQSLANSLQYGPSTLEVDNTTGAYKVRRLSTGSNSHASAPSRRSSARSTNHDRSVTFAEDAPPVPEIPEEWPLRSSTPVPEPRRRASSNGSSKKTFEIADHELNDADVGDAVTDALAKLEQNSEANAELTPVTPMIVKSHEDSAAPAPPGPSAVTVEGSPRQKKIYNPLAPRKRATYPPKSALKTAGNRSSMNSTKSTRSNKSSKSTESTTPTITEAPEPPMPRPADTIHPERPSVLERIAMSQRQTVDSPAVLELIALSQRLSPDARRILDLSLQGEIVTGLSTPDTSQSESEVSVATGVKRVSSSKYSQDLNEEEVEEEFQRLDSEAGPAAAALDAVNGRWFD